MLFFEDLYNKYWKHSVTDSRRDNRKFRIRNKDVEALNRSLELRVDFQSLLQCTNAQNRQTKIQARISNLSDMKGQSRTMIGCDRNTKAGNGKTTKLEITDEMKLRKVETRAYRLSSLYA